MQSISESPLKAGKKSIFVDNCWVGIFDNVCKEKFKLLDGELLWAILFNFLYLADLLRLSNDLRLDFGPVLEIIETENVSDNRSASFSDSKNLFKVL